MMVCTEGKTKRECSYLGGLVGWKRTKSHDGCVLNERAVADKAVYLGAYFVN